ncbi:MAG: hypothetical protein P4L53_13635 [Candidatus Obscuribacterales bacterium]|nr:hypothetical protein [Candidatus Obscuribacterales bacterium]
MSMLAVNDILIRIMLVFVGIVCVAGGLIFAKQSLDVAKNIFECVLFALLIFMTGLLMISWGFGGFPE